MALNRTQARQLLTIPEFELFTQSRTDGLKDLTPARLRSKIERTRALRDKFRDLYRRQTVATRADAAATNERTRRKAEVFEDILHRFENHLQQMDDDAAAPRAGKAGASRAAPRKRTDGATAQTAGAPARKRAATPRAGGTAAVAPGDARPAAPARRRAAPERPSASAARGDRPARAAAKPRTARSASASRPDAPAKRTAGRGTRTAAPADSAAAH